MYFAPAAGETPRRGPDTRKRGSGSGFLRFIRAREGSGGTFTSGRPRPAAVVSGLPEATGDANEATARLGGPLCQSSLRQPWYSCQVQRGGGWRHHVLVMTRSEGSGNKSWERCSKLSSLYFNQGGLFFCQKLYLIPI